MVTPKRLAELVEGEPPKQGRRRGERVDGGAEVVDEARTRHLFRTRRAADGVGLLDHVYVPPGPGEHDGGPEPVRTRPHDNGVSVGHKKR